MHKVELWELDDFFGIIVPAPTGITWSNQVGGTACVHPEIEGVYIPLPLHWFPDHDPFLDSWNEPYDYKKVKRFLQSSEYLKILSPLEEQGVLISEAWIPVMIGKSTDVLLSSFIGQLGILTYANSD